MKKNTNSVLARLTRRRRLARAYRGLSLERLDERLTLSGSPPAAFNDAFAVVQDAPLDVAASGVMANDTDAEGDALTAELFSGPSHGVLAFQADGGFHYEPAAGFTGLDSFVYRVSDGTSQSKFAAVTLRVELPTFAPALDLDGDDSSAAGADFAAVFTEGVGAAALADADAALSDADSPTLASMTVKIANPLDGEAESLAADVSGTGITAAYDPTTATLSLSGVDTAANYLQVLKTVAYSNASQNPNLAARVIAFTANDGAHDSNTAVATVTMVGVNDAPATADDAYQAQEDEPLVVAATGVLTNDSDADGDALSAVLVAGPSHGTLTMDADGSFTYAPEADFHGSDSFTYRASDGEAEGALATVTIDVAAVNDAPAAVNDSFTIDEDQPLVVAASVLANDGDLEGAVMAAEQLSGPQHGTLAFNADGSFSYMPDANFFGVDGFSYVANDGTAESDVATVTIEVAAVNDAPTSLDDAYELVEDATLDVTAAGVLANDSDVEGEALSAVMVAGPAHGTLTMNADGSFSYAPEANYFGADSFTYRANDGTDDGEIATVSLTITAANDLPVAVNDVYAGVEDETLVIDGAGALANDSDLDGDALSAVLVSPPTNGAVTLNADGSFSYVPNAEFFGTDSFSYMANDGAGDSDVATVNIEIAAANDSPVANNDDFAIDEDQELVVTAPGLLANDADVEADSLAVVVPVIGPSHGTLTANADGSFSYLPEANFHGVDAFSYQISDGVATSGVAAVTITVNAVNDAPVATEDAFDALEDETLVISAAGVLANDNDVEGDALSAVLENGPANGTVTLNADGSFSYVPNADFTGVDSFTYRASDGVATSGAVAVLINVVSTNDPAAGANDRYSVGEDNSLVMPAELGVLANDFDPDFDSLTASVLSQPAHGTLAMNPDGSFTYTPEANYFGADSFTYQSSDGDEISAANTVTVTVNAVNDAPTANAESYSVLPETPLAVDAAGGVLANDTDVEGSPLAASLLFGPHHGSLEFEADGSFVYTPAAGYAGDDGFWYQAYDGEADSNVRFVTLTVAGTTVENSPPLAVADSYSVDEDQTLDVAAAGGALANDSDVDGDAMTATLITPPEHGVLSFQADGSFQYVPETNWHGTDTFTYVANDGHADGNPVSVMIEVASVNDAAKSQNEVYTVVEGQTLDVPAGEGVLANDSDVDGDSLAAVLVAPPQHGTVELNADGSFTYVPEAGFSGTDSFSYATDDGTEESDVATATIEVSPVNNPPVATNDRYWVNAGTTLEREADAGVLINDTDADSDELTAVLFSPAAHGTVTLNADGSFTYLPDAGFGGTDSFTYRASDGTSSSFVAAVTIRVINPELRMIPEAPAVCGVQVAMCELPDCDANSQLNETELGETTLDLAGAVCDAMFTPVVERPQPISFDDLEDAAEDLWTCELFALPEDGVLPSLDDVFGQEKWSV